MPKPLHTAILYASPSSGNFRALHSYLYQLSSGSAPKVEYVLRYIPEAGEQKDKSYLSGWGVALDLKKMDYLALDDRRSNGASQLPIMCPHPIEILTTKTPFTGKSSTGDQDATDSEQEEEIDHVLALLEQYPTNSTEDYTAPLTEEELQGTHAYSTNPLLSLKH